MRTVVDAPTTFAHPAWVAARVGGMPLRNVAEEERGLAQWVSDSPHNPLESICGADGIGKPPAWTVSLTGSSELKARNPLA